jgi:hypothetical protein
MREKVVCAADIAVLWRFSLRGEAFADALDVVVGAATVAAQQTRFHHLSAVTRVNLHAPHLSNFQIALVQ